MTPAGRATGGSPRSGGRPGNAPRSSSAAGRMRQPSAGTHPPAKRADKERQSPGTKASSAKRPPAARHRWPGERVPPPSIRWLLVAAGVCTVPAVLLLVLHLAPEVQAAHQWLVMAASFAPFGWLAWAAAVLLALLGARGRVRLVVAVLGLGLAWHTAVLVPYLPGGQRATAASGSEPGPTLLALSLHDGQADLAALGKAVAAADPDLLVLTEATPAVASSLRRQEWAKALPHRFGPPERGLDGTLVLSRYELGPTGDGRGTTDGILAIKVSLPARPFVLIGAHPSNPEAGVRPWLQDGEILTRLAVAQSSGPLVVAGDLNATAEHLTLRTLLAKAGLSDTATGAGWHPTYPADAWFPPLIQIDHVLVSRDFSASSLRTVSVPGTDHLGVLVDLTLA